MELGIQPSDLEAALQERLISESDDIELPWKGGDKVDDIISTTEPEVKSSVDSYKDILFLCAFVIHLLMVAAIALSYGAVALANNGADYLVISPSGTESFDNSYDAMPAKFVFGMFMVLALSAVFALAWMYFLARTATYVVYTLIMSVVVISILSGMTLLSMGYTFFGLPLMSVAIITLVVALLWQERITFAASNLQVACEAVLATSSTIALSLGVLLLQITYTIVWSVAVVGFATNAYQVTRPFGGVDYPLDQCSSYKYYNTLTIDSTTLTCPSGGPCYACVCDDRVISSKSCYSPRFYWFTLVLFLLSLFWTNSVLANIVHVTSAGAVWDWWHIGTCSQEMTVVYLKRACTTSLGSICTGSLLSAIVRVTRTVLHAILYCSNASSKGDAQTRWAAERSSAWSQFKIGSLQVLRDLLDYLDHVVVFFNRYAFCFIAIDQTDYMTASKTAVTLFQSRGISTLVNNDLLDTVLTAVTATIALFCMALSYLYCKYVLLTHTYAAMLAVVALVGGYIVSTIVFAPLVSAIVAVYVCFARDPVAFEVRLSIPCRFPFITLRRFSHAFPSHSHTSFPCWLQQKCHPKLYAPLANCWCRVYPSSLQLAQNRVPLADDGQDSSTSNTSTTPRVIRGSFKVPVLNPQSGPAVISSGNNPFVPLSSPAGSGKLTRAAIAGSAAAPFSAPPTQEWSARSWGQTLGLMSGAARPTLRPDPRDGEDATLL